MESKHVQIRFPERLLAQLPWYKRKQRKKGKRKREKGGIS